MTLVIDASAVVELVLDTDRGRRVRDHLGDEDLVAPDLIVAEACSVLRGLELGGHLEASRARGALEDLGDLGIETWELGPFVGRAWRWRHRISAYDAFYVALAEALACPLLTCDERLARGVGQEIAVLT